MLRWTSLLLIPTLSAIAICAEERPIMVGTQEFALQGGDLKRTYLLHVPPQYDGTKPLPLVMVFHGGAGTAKNAEQHYHWSEKADQEGVIVVYPNGTGMFQTWNAVHGCGSAFNNHIDDVGFVKAMLKDLDAKVKIDPKRIYATGISNGAFLSYRLAAEMSETFAAIAPVAGAIGGKENANAKEKRIPEPANPVSVIIFHGKADMNVLYDGGQTKKGLEKDRIDLSVADAVAFWTKVNGCSGTPKKEESADGKVITESYSGDKGDVTLYTIVKGGHSWPGGKATKLKVLDAPASEISATDLSWDFFKAHPKK
jgi:polyhydroxybutyrate depolymerase